MAVNGRNNGGLAPKREAVALALAAGQSHAEAARTAGAGERTVHRWLTQGPALRDRVAELRAAMNDRTLGWLTDAGVYATATLRKLLGSKNEGIQLGAARALLDLRRAVHESTELAAELAEVKRLVAELIHERDAENRNPEAARNGHGANGRGPRAAGGAA